MQSWYLLYTKPKKDALAEAELRKQRYEVFRPTINRYQIRDRSRHAITESLFPRYLFINLNEESCDWVGVRSTRGVSNFVRFGRYPTRVRAEMVEAIQQLVDGDSMTDETAEQPAFEKGDVVEIVDGSLKGYQALVSSQSGEERVVILLKMLGQQLSVTVPAASLRPGDAVLARIQNVL